MDNHLNLFYSYGQGSTKRADSSIQLEDNLTRAFIVLLKNLNIKLQIKILKKIIPENIQYTIRSKEFCYDLQNTTQQRKGKKFLIVIQRYINNDLQTLVTENTKTSINEFKEDNNNLKKLKSCIINGTDFRFNGITYPNNELLSLYEIVHDNRPDGWILGDKETFLIETKIGNNSVSSQQIFRHITQGNGFNCHKIVDVEIIQLEWQSLYKIISDIKTSNAKYDFLLKQFKEYLEMTGQVLNLNYILEGNINPEQHKEQFVLFLDLFEGKLLRMKPNKSLSLKRRAKKINNLWDIIGIKDNNNIKEDPHYSIAFNKDCILFSLTSKKISIKKTDSILDWIFVENNNFVEFSSRLYLQQEDYRKVSGRGGFPGENHSIYKNNIRVNLLVNQFNEDNNKLIQFRDSLKNIRRSFNYKQFEFGLIIEFYNFKNLNDNKEDIRTQNKQLIENPEELAKLFINFIEKSWELFEYLNNSNTSPSPQSP